MESLIVSTRLLPFTMYSKTSTIHPLIIALVVVIATFESTHAWSQSPQSGALYALPDENTNTTTTDSSLTQEFFISLDADQKLDLADLLASLADELGLDGNLLRRKTSRKVDSTTLLSKAQIKGIEKATGGIVEIRIMDAQLIVTYDRLKFQQESKRIRTDLQNTIARWLPDAVQSFKPQYGFRIHADLNHQNVNPENFDFTAALNPANPQQSPRQFIILVHGLDDPGRIWNSARPILLKHGYIVCEFDYPNDQAIVPSAKLFAENLKQLRSLGLTHASIVAHSMGGLVARETLTNPTYYHGDATGNNTYPTIDRFIMAGTPNHGAAMAHLRFTAEIRDQITRAISGDGILFGGSLDGSGEAESDLLPNSDFLRTLNARPLPDNTTITIIAGKTSPIDENEIQNLAGSLKQNLPSSALLNINALVIDLNKLTNGLGDGVVSVNSTKLSGVSDFVIVPGNHLTMVRNLPWHDDTRIPPAIQITLDRLNIN